VGAVAGSGLVQIHRDGWRAEYCELLALAAPSLEQAPGTFMVADLYGVPLLAPEELAKASTYENVIPAPNIPEGSSSVKERP